MVQMQPAVIAALLGVGISQLIALIWILSSSRQQIVTLTEAVKDLRQAITAIEQFRSHAEVRIARIEAQCAMLHGDDRR